MCFERCKQNKVLFNDFNRKNEKIKYADNVTKSRPTKSSISDSSSLNFFRAY